MRGWGALMVLGVVGVAGCATDRPTQDDTMPEESEAIVFGPVDGHDLPGVDLERVHEGQMAPDFTLASLSGPPVTLSSFRGAKNVVLVFYRGHW